MSFYGNITNANKSNLIFDKIYPNKQQMISEAASDNIFVGRYVLIEYDDNSHPYLKGYDKVSTLRDDTFRGPLYTDTTYTQPFRASTASTNGYTLKINDIVAVDYNPYRVFYKCTNTSGQAQFKREKIIT